MEKSIKGSVLVISERYYPERFLINDLVNQLVLDGADVRVLTQAPSYPEDRLYPGYENLTTRCIENGVSVTRFKTVLGYKSSLIKKLLNYASFMVRSCLLVLRESKDVDAVFVYHTGPLTQALPLAIVKLFRRTRTVIWTQDVWPDAVFAYGFPSRGAFAVLLKAFVRFIYRFSDEVLVSSPGFVDRLKPYCRSGTSIRFVPQWVPDAFLRADRPSVDLHGEGARFIFTGNIGTMQNLENVIKAFGRIDPQTATFLLLGDGNSKARFEEFVSLEGMRNVRFLGSVEVSEVKASIEACDFSVLSLSSNELISLTIPAKFQTYLAATRPILAVARGEVKGIVESRGLGITADPEDIDSIVEAIKRASTSTTDERSVWSANMTSYLHHFDKRIIITDIENILELIF